jgi:hypothetical protein
MHRFFQFGVHTPHSCILDCPSGGSIGDKDLLGDQDAYGEADNDDVCCESLH